MTHGIDAVASFVFTAVIVEWAKQRHDSGWVDCAASKAVFAGRYCKQHLGVITGS